MRECRHKEAGPVTYSPFGFESASCDCGRQRFELVTETEKQLVTTLVKGLQQTGYHIQEKDGKYTMSFPISEDTMSVIGQAIREDLDRKST